MSHPFLLLAPGVYPLARQAADKENTDEMTPEDDEATRSLRRCVSVSAADRLGAIGCVKLDDLPGHVKQRCKVIQ